MNKKEKMDWSIPSSICVPLSVVKQLDEFKRKHGYTSRPQTMVALIEIAEKNDMAKDIKKMLQESPLFQETIPKNKTKSTISILHYTNLINKVDDVLKLDINFYYRVLIAQKLIEVFRRK